MEVPLSPAWRFPLLGQGGEQPLCCCQQSHWVGVPQPAEPGQCIGLATPLLGGSLKRGRSSPFLPACLLPACLPGKGRRGRAGPCSPPTPNPSNCIHSLAAY